MQQSAARLRITGIVQGVGFRPFVYRIAVKHGLAGYTLNLGGSEVEIWVEGARERIEDFIKDLKRLKPPPAVIERLSIEWVRPRGYSKFRILKSGSSVKEFSMIPPDIGVCDECLREVYDPCSRWYMYPFNSCAWCGPRFSMMYKVPYDRENTAMRDFPLCEECIKEYEDPANERRFHAQGISCPKCGPRLELRDAEGEPLECSNPLLEAARLVDEGYIVAIKGLGGFHLAALATDDEAVGKLRLRKRRPQKPFALMALSVDVVRRIGSPGPEHIELLRSPQRPIVLVPKREDTPVSKLVAPGLAYIGVMLPYTPLHHLLLNSTHDRFLIMTSGNPPGQPLVKDNEEAYRLLRGIADYFLVHNREIVNRVDDSVVRISMGEPLLLRRARGYAPAWIGLPLTVKKPILALGAHLANAGGLGVREYCILTQYVGDMEKVENLEFLLNALGFLIRAYRVKTDEVAIAHDAHPAYATTLLGLRLAEEWGVEAFPVQHHHAHIASAMASRGINAEEDVVGIAVDGMGYGDDGALWGGEVMLTTYSEYKRVAHLQYLPLPGGDRAVEYPARTAIAVLASELGEDEGAVLARRLGLVDQLPYGDRELRAVLSQASSAPRTSGLGRLLDAISAVLGICGRRTYEGEPAMKLEAAAFGGSLINGMKLEVEGDRCRVVLTAKLVLRAAELRGREPLRDIAYTVQYELGRALGLLAAEHLGVDAKHVVVSGGAAVNEVFLKGLAAGLGRKPLLPRGVPPGDGGIALGQVAVVAAQMSARG